MFNGRRMSHRQTEWPTKTNSKMTAEEIFPDLGKFQKYSDGMIADTSIGQLMPSIRTAVYDVAGIITQDVFDAVMASEAKEPVQLLKTAVACMASYNYQIFATSKKNGSEASMYKYQHEEMKSHHLEAYWAAMDRLLDWLDANPQTGGWQDTPEYMERLNLPVKSASEFDFYFGIGKSSLFFHKVLYLIRQNWNQEILPALPADASARMMDLAKQALCYKVMALAVMQFDVTELPRAVRYDDSHEYSKASSPQQRVSLYNQFIAKYSSLMSSIERLKAAGIGKSSFGSDQTEDQKFYSVL